jgi:hypothetical protein
MKSALLIGLNYSRTPYQLNGCINDVTNMTSLLLSNGYSLNNVTTLIDSDPKRMPTKQRILQELKKIVSSRSSELFIFYSGHGSRVKDINKDEQDGMDSVIVPCDFKTNGFIIDDELLSIIKNITCKCTLLFDSCNSGTVCDLPFSYTYVKNNLFSLTRNKFINIENPNIYMMSGCKDTQYSEEVYQNKKYGGAFTNAFLKNYTSSKTMINLYADICKLLPSRQQPIFSSSSLPLPTNKLFSLSKMIFT